MQRSSKKRDAVLGAVKASRSHPTAQDVWFGLHSEFPDLSLATVYRNLGEFAAAGQVRRLDGLDGQSRFDGDLTPHSHFTCTRCGKISDIPLDVPERLDEEVARMLGGVITGHELSFFGLCAECAAEKDGKEEP